MRALLSNRVEQPTEMLSGISLLLIQPLLSELLQLANHLLPAAHEQPVDHKAAALQIKSWWKPSSELTSYNFSRNRRLILSPWVHSPIQQHTPIERLKLGPGQIRENLLQWNQEVALPNRAQVGRTRFPLFR